MTPSTTTTQLRPAFSLAELMIALAILGFGLLVIAAALPVGIQKTRETVERAAGDAATDYITDVLRTRLRLHRDLQRDSIFRPRNGAGDLATDPVIPARDYEPWIKVRPLITENIYAFSDDQDRGSRVLQPVDLIEQQVFRIMADASEINSSYPTGGLPLWSEAVPTGESFDFDGQEGGLLPPALSLFEMVFPPVAPSWDDRERYTPETFFDNPYDRYVSQYVDEDELSYYAAAFERQTAVVVFYRRQAYDKVQDVTVALESEAEDNRYEFIVVTIRRPQPNLRFPLPNAESASDWDPDRPEPLVDGGVVESSLLPVPWLVRLQPRVDMWLEEGDASNGDYFEFGDGRYDRPLTPEFVEPAQLRFNVSFELSQVLREGSVLIPAVNDEALSLFGNRYVLSSSAEAARLSGFVPHLPDQTPIYRVTEVDTEQNSEDFYTVSVANNGVYPWVADDISENDRPLYWPVWIIPPGFTETAGEQPLYLGGSPIISVTRRTLTLPEVQ